MRLRVFVLLPLFFATAIATAGPAQADVIRPISTKVGVGDLRQACSRGGGNFSVHADGGGYSCIKENCDGKGGTCSVACDNNNNCNGSTPTRITKPMTLIGLLQNGDEVVRDPKPSGTPGSLSSPGTTSAAPAAAPQVVIIP